MLSSTYHLVTRETEARACELETELAKHKNSKARLSHNNEIKPQITIKI